MRREKSDPVYLWDMLDAAQAVVEFTARRSFNDYLKDRMLRAAVERSVEIMGEAERQISSEFQALHPEIPWRKIIVQRHVLAHEYGEIRHDLIWRVATVHVPALITQLKPLVPAPPEEPEDFQS